MDAPEGGGGNVLTHKLGPLPTWAWAAIIVGAAVAARLYRSRFGAQVGPAATPEGDTLNGSGTGPLTGGGSGAVTDLNGPAFTTNSGWRNAAEAWLILTAGADPITADSALTRYLTGQCLDAAELAAVGLVLGHYGPPPDGGQPAPTPCATVQTPPGVSTPVAPPPSQVSTGPVLIANPTTRALDIAAGGTGVAPAPDQPQGYVGGVPGVDMFGRSAPAPGWTLSGGQWYPPGVYGESWYSTNFQALEPGPGMMWPAYTGPGSMQGATPVPVPQSSPTNPIALPQVPANTLPTSFIYGPDGGLPIGWTNHIDTLGGWHGR